MAVVLTIAVAQLLLAIVGTPAALARVPWPYIANVFGFGVGGLVLLAGGGRDRRLPLLGGLFLTISSAFVFSVMPQPGVAFGGTLTALLRPLQPDAFLPLMLWRFVRAFPADSHRPTVRRIADAFIGVSFGVGTVLFVTSAVGYLADLPLLAELTTRCCLRCSVRPGARSSSILKHWSRLRECFPRPIESGWTTPTRICCSRSWVHPGCFWGCW